MTAALPLDADRLWADIMALAEITEPARPYTRRSFSPLFLKGRAWLAEQFAEAGLAVRIDAAGNLIGRFEGKNPALGVIAIGSHSDTVPSGGRFDGIAGVAAGLEVARALRDAQVRLDHTLEVIDFLAEEPSDYGLSCVGSRGMAGALEARDARYDRTARRDFARGVAPGRWRSGLFHIGASQRHRGVSGIAHRAGHRSGIAIARCRYCHLDCRHPPHRDHF